MNTKISFIFLAILALSLTFVSAAEQVVYETPIEGVNPSGNQNQGGIFVGSQNPMQIAPNDPSVQFNLVSPNSNTALETTNILEVTFNFVATAYDFHDGNYLDSCSITVSNGDVLDVDFDHATGVGTAKDSLVVGDYSWQVTCTSDSGTVWTSNAVDFAVRTHVAQVELGEPSVVINNPVVSSDDNEGNGRRRAGAGTPLTPLSTTPGSQNPQSNSNNGDSSSDEFSGITGAVVGLFGKKGALGVGIFLVVVGLVALTIYNREFLGIVKAK